MVFAPMGSLDTRLVPGQVWVIFPRGPSVRYRSASAMAPSVEGEKVPLSAVSGCSTTRL